VRTGYGKETEANLDEDFHARGGKAFDALPAALDWILTKK